MLNKYWGRVFAHLRAIPENHKILAILDHSWPFSWRRARPLSQTLPAPQTPFTHEARNDRQIKQRVMPSRADPRLGDRRFARRQAGDESRQVAARDDFAARLGSDLSQERTIRPQAMKLFSFRLRDPTGFSLADRATVRGVHLHRSPISARLPRHVPRNVRAGFVLVRHRLERHLLAVGRRHFDRYLGIVQRQILRVARPYANCRGTI